MVECQGDREELVVQLSLLESQEPKLDLFNSPISEIFGDGIVVFSSETSVSEALNQLKNSGAEAALVKESEHSILGMVDKPALQEGSDLEGRNTLHSRIRRNFSIEPHQASLLEVTDRLTKGSAHAVLTVDARGYPHSLITPSMILKLLKGSVIHPRVVEKVA